MRRKSLARQPIPGGKTHTTPVRDRRLVLVNEVPLRQRAATEFKRAMAKLEKARTELRRFEKEDGPAFGRWMAASFGALQTVTRENALLIAEQRALVEEVEMEMIWGNHRSPQKAYAAVMKRRENPEPDDRFGDEYARDGAEGEHTWEEDSENRGGPDDEGEFTEEERRELFEDFISFLGIDPKGLGREEYANMFAQYQFEKFGDVSGAGSFAMDDAGISSKSPHEARIKEIYRILVRRLHPDLRADRDSEVSSIWHEVQEAYEARNVDRLETLLALTELENGGDGGQSTLSQMRGALGELKRSLGAIQRSIRQAKKDPAWNFQIKGGNVVLERCLRREIESHMFQQQRVLADLKRILDDWSRPWQPPARAKAAPRKKAPPKAESGRAGYTQTEFF